MPPKAKGPVASGASSKKAAKPTKTPSPKKPPHSNSKTGRNAVVHQCLDEARELAASVANEETKSRNEETENPEAPATDAQGYALVMEGDADGTDAEGDDSATEAPAEGKRSERVQQHKRIEKANDDMRK